MKRNILLLLALVILIGASWYLINKQQNSSKKSFDFEYREFAIDDLDDLKKIVLTKRNAPSIQFKKTSDHWMIDDRYLARENAINNMLDVIKNIRIDYVPPHTATENIMKSFLRHGIKVELYGNNDKTLKTYYVGSSPADGMGTYFVMEGYDKPIVMSLPSMKGNVHTRFNYKLEEWRDMTVIDQKKGNIESIEVSYPFNKKFSFKIENDELKPLHPFQKPIEGKANPKMVSTYLAGFEQKTAEYIENNNPKKDSIVAQIPFCEVRLKTKSNELKEMRFFYLNNPEYDDSHIGEMDTYNPYHAERFFIQTNWGDFYLAQMHLFKDVFWKYDFFYKE